MSYARLEQNLTDLIKEEQAKLGYRREAIRLYYPLASLQHLTGTCDPVPELLRQLTDWFSAENSALGCVSVSEKEGRFCFLIPPEGSEYVHTRMRSDEFICQLVSLVGAHASMTEILALFERQAQPCEVKPADGAEFDVRVRFTAGDDPYYYCFKEEGHHVTYHRFLPEDYREFGFETE